MCKIWVQNFIIKDILKKKNDVHWISVRTIIIISTNKCLTTMTQRALCPSQMNAVVFYSYAIFASLILYKLNIIIWLILSQFCFSLFWKRWRILLLILFYSQPMLSERNGNIYCSDRHFVLFQLFFASVILCYAIFRFTTEVCCQHVIPVKLFWNASSLHLLFG